MKKVYVFTLPNCSACKGTIELLKNDGIPHIELPTDKHEKIWKKVRRLGDAYLLPTVFIQDNSDGSGYVYTPNRDFTTFDELVKIIKNNI